MVGVWLQVLLQRMEETLKSRETPFYLLELGPGSGELSVDILRTLLSLRKSLRNINLGFVEVSERLKLVQQQKLLKFLESHKMFMSYHSSGEGEGEGDGSAPKVDFFSNERGVIPFTMTWASSIRDVVAHDLIRRKEEKMLVFA